MSWADVTVAMAGIVVVVITGAFGGHQFAGNICAQNDVIVVVVNSIGGGTVAIALTERRHQTLIGAVH